MISLKREIEVSTISSNSREQIAMASFQASSEATGSFDDRTPLLLPVNRFLQSLRECCHCPLFWKYLAIVFFYVRFVLSIVGTLVGFSIFFVFFIRYVNYHAAVAGLLSGILAAGVLHLHILHLRGKMEDWYTPAALVGLQGFGLVLALLYVIAMAVYLYLAISKHQAYTVDVFSYYPAATFSFLAFKWGFALSFEARHYKQSLLSSSLALLSGVRVYPDSDSESLG